MGAIVVCTWGTSLTGGASEVEGAFTLARKLAGDANELRWLALGELPEGASATAAKHGVAAIDHVADGALDGTSADALVSAVADYAGSRSPSALLFPQTFDTRVVAPRLAGRLGASVVMNAVAIEVAGDTVQVTATAYGGDTRVVYEVAAAELQVLAVLTNLVTAEALATPGAEPAVESVSVDLSGLEERIRIIEEPQVTGARLEEAEVIVSGGKGLGQAENYRLIEELAAALGGMAGASRPIVDEGWVDSSHQVGLTGKITRPTLYLAAGISGASQHMAGCSGSNTIAAINTDADASIFRYARFGVVGDCVEVLPELIRVAKEGRS